MTRNGMNQLCKKITDRSINTLIAGRGGSDNQLWGKCLKNAGFQNIFRATGAKAAINMMETESIEWVIIPAFWEDPGNTAYHLLKACIRYPEIQNTLVTLSFTEEEAGFHIPLAAAWGGFNWFVGCNQGDKFDGFLREQDELIERFAGDVLRITSEYLVPTLKQENQHDLLIKLMRAQLKINPGDSFCLTHLADAMALQGDKPGAASVVQQIALIHNDPQSQQQVEKLRQTHSLSSEGGGGANQVFSECKVALYMVSQELENSFKSVLDRHGVESQVYSDAESLTRAMEAEPAKIILCQWDDMDDKGGTDHSRHGSLVLQRLRDSGIYGPICGVISDMISSTENELLQEMGVFYQLKCGIEENQLLRYLVSMLHDDAGGYNAKMLVHKIRSELSNHNRDGAVVQFAILEQLESVDEALKLLAEGEISYYDGDFDLSKDLGYEALALPGEPVQALNLIGKSLMKLGEFDLAFTCFDNAQLVSPLNIGRLAAMAETCVANDELEQAGAMLDECQAADSGNPAVAEAASKYAITTGDTDTASELLGNMAEISSVVAFMNNKAVVRSQNNDFKEALDLYAKALESLPTRHKKYASTIHYNKGLMHLRNGENELAIEHLAQCKAKDNEVIAKKASNIIATIHKAKAEKRKVRLAAPQTKEAKDLNVKAISRRLNFSLSVAQVTPGQRSLYGIMPSHDESGQFNERVKQDLLFKEKHEHSIEGKKVWT